jgi:amino acid adenylation domain-containing protein
MNITDLISHLRDLGLRLWADGERLRYKAPPGVLTPALRADLAEHKSELLAFLRDARNTVGSDTYPITPVEHNGPLPLSFAQQRLWFLDQLEPGSTQYNIVRAFRLRGALNVSALQQSLNEIISRHAVLRTTFRTVQGNPVQQVALVSAITIAAEDLTQLTKSKAMALTKQRVVEEYRRPFDLNTGPVIRFRLMHLSQKEHIFVVTVHHIAADGWSIGVFFRELGILYEAFTANLPSPLEELPIQYADFAVWQREWLQGEVLDTQMSYWKNKLRDLSTLELSTDRSRPAVQTFQGARESLVLSESLSRELRELSRKDDATVFMTLLAAFVVLLHRYSGQDDIVVGTPIANRNRAEIESLIGFFVNTLAMRTDVSGHPSFRQLLTRVRTIALEAYQHQDVPFENLVEELEPHRDLSRNPLFQVLFALQNAPAELLELRDLTLGLMEIDAVTTRFDLEIHLWDESEGLRVWFIYNTDLFDAETIQRMLGHFQNLLKAIVADPEFQIAHLPILTHMERRQLLTDWNRTATDYPEDTVVHELFEEQEKRTPDALAVIHDQTQLSYGQLNVRANQLAHYLRALGVGPEKLVGICVERSIAMVVGVLGVLKAGGGYLPLDPSYPRDRLAFMLSDAKPMVVLTQTHLLERLPSKDMHALCLDRDEDAWSGLPARDPENKTLSSNVAYVIYTSGSTGQPKGIVMPHRALCNLVRWQLENTTVRREARTLQFASLSFDVSFQELFSTWCSGGALVLVTERQRRDPVALLNFLNEVQVERVYMPFVALQQLAEAAMTEGQVPWKLREVITAGEQLQITPAIVKLFERLQQCTLHNQYGPSEAHVVTSLVLDGNPSQWPRLPSIGRPIANVKIYLLDRHLRPVPVGVPGELCIGGMCVAQGYLGRPELSAERFIPDPFSHRQDACLYKTGDLARYLSEGNIEFLGRIDHQVKIRGFRVELGEVEAILAQHPSVRETAATIQENFSDGQRLVAYVVLHQGQSTTAGEMRLFLKQKLPDYMVPSAFVLLDSLPVTPSGKIDRRALPQPDRLRPDLKAGYEAPQTEIERIIASVWQEVLDLEKVGLYDNFFDLGGHSLLLTQAYNRLREILGAGFSLISMFQFPTVSALAQYLGQEKGGRGVFQDEENWVEKLHAGKDRLAQLHRRRHLARQQNRKE